MPICVWIFLSVLTVPDADMMIANDIGSRYNNSDYNEVFLVDSKNVVKTGRKTKAKIVKIIRKNIEKNLN